MKTLSGWKRWLVALPLAATLVYSAGCDWFNDLTGKSPTPPPAPFEVPVEYAGRTDSRDAYFFNEKVGNTWSIRKHDPATGTIDDFAKVPNVSRKFLQMVPNSNYALCEENDGTDTDIVHIDTITEQKVHDSDIKGFDEAVRAATAENTLLQSNSTTTGIDTIHIVDNATLQMTTPFPNAVEVHNATPGTHNILEVLTTTSDPDVYILSLNQQNPQPEFITTGMYGQRISKNGQHPILKNINNNQVYWVDRANNNALIPLPSGGLQQADSKAVSDNGEVLIFAQSGASRKWMYLLANDSDLELQLPPDVPDQFVYSPSGGSLYCRLNGNKHFHINVVDGVLSDLNALAGDQLEYVGFGANDECIMNSSSGIQCYHPSTGMTQLPIDPQASLEQAFALSEDQTTILAVTENGVKRAATYDLANGTTTMGEIVGETQLEGFLDRNRIPFGFLRNGPSHRGRSYNPTELEFTQGDDIKSLDAGQSRLLYRRKLGKRVTFFLHNAISGSNSELAKYDEP